MDNIKISVGGDVTGELVIGKQNTVIHTNVTQALLTEAELSGLRKTIDSLKAEVATQAPPDKQAAAVQQLDQMHQAIKADKPELSKIEKVRDWFVKNVPTMAGAVTAMVVNPIVGRLVQIGGDALVAELRGGKS